MTPQDHASERGQPADRRRTMPRGQGDASGVLGGSGRSGVLLLIAVFLIPNVLGPSLGGVALTPIRTFLLIMAVPTVIAFTRRRGGRLYGFDWCILAFVFWTAFAILLKEGAGGIETAGQFVLEFGVLYFFIQGQITRTGQIEAAFRLLFWSVVVLGVIAAAESITHRYWVLDISRKLVGLPGVGETAERRLGLTRASTVFSNYILYGVYCATLLSMTWFLTKGTFKRLLKVAAIMGAAFFSISSAAILIIIVQFLLLSAERVTRGIPRRLFLGVLSAAAMVVALNLFTERGVTGTVILLSLSSSTAYMRKLIWEHAKDDALRSPLIGIEPENWTRPEWMAPSIDNFWLFQSLEGGLPSVAFLLLALFLISRRLFRIPPNRLPEILLRLRTGWGFLILALILCGMTVHFFDKAQPYFAMMVGFGAALVRLMMDWEERTRERPGRTEDAARPPPSAEDRDRRSWL